MDSAFHSWRKREFPFFQHKIFLTHASVSPLPARSRDALRKYAEIVASEGQFDPAHEHLYRRCKERFAELIGPPAKPEEIAFAGSTSHALGLVATSLDWQVGDNCIVADGDFPANVITWKNLEQTRGVEVRMLPFRAAMDLTMEDIAPLVNERTRLVSLASANFLSGCPVDINAIGAWLHERGVLFCVDAIQTLGAIEFDATHVDFVCADAHKWLLGPNGTAVLWVRGEVLPRLHPQILGWLAVEGRDNWLAYDTTPINTAERFEPGARNYLGIVATEASLALLQEFGMARVEQRVIELRDYAVQKLEAIGCHFLWHPTPGSRGGVVTFQPPHSEIAALYNHLEQRFALSLRQDRFGSDWLRVSAHFMNCEADLDALTEAIQAFER